MICVCCERADIWVQEHTRLCRACQRHGDNSQPACQIYVNHHFADVAAVWAGSKEDALALFQRKYRECGGGLNPRELADIETLDEFVERARRYWC